MPESFDLPTLAPGETFSCNRYHMTHCDCRAAAHSTGLTAMAAPFIAAYLNLK